MEKNQLIERYIYAVTKRMKPAARKDVAEELMSIIQDMLDEKCSGMTPTDRDIRIVLAELGTPSELYQKYDSDGQACLIGQPYYGTYKYVMKIVLMCVTASMFIAQTIAAIMGSKIWYRAVFDIITGITGGSLSAFAFVTLIFAVFYKKGIKMEGFGDSIDNLPPVPEKKKTIPKSDAIIGIVVSLVFTIIFLVCPQIISIYWKSNGTTQSAPIFNLEYIRQTWYFIVIFAALGITRDSVKLLEGSYTKRLMIVTVSTNILDIILTYAWFINGKVMNTEFYTAVNNLFGEKAQSLNLILNNFNKFFLGIIVFAMLINTAETVIRTLMNHSVDN